MVLEKERKAETIKEKDQEEFESKHPFESREIEPKLDLIF